jgi:uncharacterized protein (DUF305 family)
VSGLSTLLRGRAGATAVALVAAAVGIVAGLLLGSQYLATDRAAQASADSSVDAGFARDMQVHHAQAVQMSTLVRDATDDEEVRTLALDVLLTQQQQIGQMHGWLTAWDLPQTSSDPTMAWMDGDGAAGMEGHPMDGAPASAGRAEAMMGMASGAQLQDLAQAEGPEAARLYLQLMVPHHQAAVTMAEAAAVEAQTPEVRRLAQSIVDSQQAEIAVLEQMLATRGGPVPTP